MERSCTGAALLALPRDALLTLCSVLDPADIAAVGGTCRELSELAASDELWRHKLLQRFAPVIKLAFGDVFPQPRSLLSWRAHYMEFGCTWMLRAKQDHNRVIFTIGGHVYDATSYVDDHPGMPAFLLSAAGTDATSAFQLSGHSANAHRILRLFAVPALDRFQPPRLDRSGSWGGSYPAGVRSGAAANIDEVIHDGRALPAKRWSPQSSPSHFATWRAVIHTLHVLARSAQGRQSLWGAASNLVNAAVVDMDRLGRDPIDAGEGGAIQRFLPVVWRLSCVECAALARLL